MGTPSQVSPAESRPSVATGIVMRAAAVVIAVAVQIAIFLLAAGRSDWIWAWVYLGICVVFGVIQGAIMLRTSPETLAERGRMRITRRWDKVISLLYLLDIALVIPLVAGLDVRAGWTSELSTTWHVVGAIVFVAGSVFAGWAMIANAFFSTAVRIQDERGHTVCRSGPYQFVRHPGYVGFILEWLGLPLILGSLWALIPGVAAGVLLITRTFWEDRTLQAELPGYLEFAQEVRYRLVPGIW